MAKRDATANEVGLTQRQDTWWLQPLSVAVALTLFGIYSTWAALQGRNFEFEPYLSPFYSPTIPLGWWPFSRTPSPAIFILWIPLGFRLTCYYYRKAYYRSFFWDPPACAVGEVARKGYHGERRFPFILQNLHRYLLYAAIVVLGFLWYDVVRAFVFDGHFGVGVGTLVLLANTSLLSLYTLSCHSLRHLSGGCFDCLAARPTRYKLWRWVSRLNVDHPTWAWLSLIVVAVADLYIRLVASGVITDLRLI